MRAIKKILMHPSGALFSTDVVEPVHSKKTSFPYSPKIQILYPFSYWLPRGTQFQLSDPLH